MSKITGMIHLDIRTKYKSDTDRQTNTLADRHSDIQRELK